MNYVLSTLAMFVGGIVVPLLIAVGVQVIEKKTHTSMLSKCIGL